MSKKITVVELKKICKRKGIKGYSKMKKATLLKHCKKSPSPKKPSPKKPSPAKKSPKKSPKQTVAQLKARCKRKGIKGYSKMKKATLLRHCNQKTPAKKSPKKKVSRKKMKGGGFMEMLEQQQREEAQQGSIRNNKNPAFLKGITSRTRFKSDKAVIAYGKKLSAWAEDATQKEVEDEGAKTLEAYTEPLADYVDDKTTDASFLKKFNKEVLYGPVWEVMIMHHGSTMRDAYPQDFY